MDLPFQNNNPQPANQEAGGDFWNFDGKSGETGSYGDDVTLNELLALYQSANEAAPPFAPMNEPEAYPLSAAPVVFAPAAPVQSMPWDVVETTPAQPDWEASDLGLVPSTTWEIPEPEVAINKIENVPAFFVASPEPEVAINKIENAPSSFVAAPEPEVAINKIENAPSSFVASPVPEAAINKIVPVASTVVSAAISIPSDLPVVQGAQALVTSEARRDATVRIEQLAGGLAQGIDAVQGQLNSAYERLATAAASRAPVLDIIEITNALSEVKVQVGVNSPLYEQALVLRQLADSYLDLLKSF